MTVWKPAMKELEPAQLGEGMVLVLQCRLDPVFRAQVAHEDGDDQGVRLVAGHLHETRRCGVYDVLILEVAEVLHIEETARVRAGHPGRLATPCTNSGKSLELGVHPFETLLGKSVQPVVEHSTHAI